MYEECLWAVKAWKDGSLGVLPREILDFSIIPYLELANVSAKCVFSYEFFRARDFINAGTAPIPLTPSVKQDIVNIFRDIDEILDINGSDVLLSCGLCPSGFYVGGYHLRGIQIFDEKQSIVLYFEGKGNPYDLNELLNMAYASDIQFEVGEGVSIRCTEDFYWS